MSLLYAPSFKYPEGDLRKNQEFLDSGHHYHQQNQQQQHNSWLMRYRSAPSSLLESLVNGNNGSSDGGGGNCEDYRYFRPSSPEIDNFLAKYMLPCNGSGDSGGGARDLQDFGEKAMKQEVAEPIITQHNGYSNGSSQIVYQTLPVHSLENDNSVSAGKAMDNSFSVVSSIALENSMQENMATENSSNLKRQNSSPAGVFSNLGVDSGFAVMRDSGCFRACNGTNGEASPSTSRVNNQLSFSSGLSSRLMPSIAEFGNRSMGTTNPEKNLGGDNGSSTQCMSNFPRDSWDRTSFSGVKRVRENDGSMLFGLSAMETQNGNSGNQSTRLAHHLSLPKISAEMAAMEKFLQFQGSIPCKIRAKRGFATHPRSIAERMRRTRISERIRKLQDLFPNMDKQTNTADMLDIAVEYIKDLQKQVETLTDNKAKCTCPSNRRHY